MFFRVVVIDFHAFKDCCIYLFEASKHFFTVSDLPADPEPVSYDILGPDDYDEAQVLSLIRMWSGFESEMITDAQLIELLGLDGYLGTDLPDWMMTDLGVLVANGDVTVDEFVPALQYVLEHA